MRISVSVEYRFQRTPEGAVWTSSAYPYPFWTQFLAVFEAVQVVARVQEVARAEAAWARCDGPGVSFAAMPYYVGPLGYLRQLRRTQRAAAQAVGADEAALLYVPSPLGSFLAGRLRRRGQPYGVHVVGDPAAVFAPGVIEHPLRPLLQWWTPRQLRQVCAGACAASYVTEAYLQRLYPCPGQVAGISDVELPAQALVGDPRPERPPVTREAPLRVVYVGSLAQLYKGPDVMLEAVARCVGQGLPVALTMVGDGGYRGMLEARAAELGLGEQVRFTGNLPAGAAVREQLDAADLFVLPSRTEGLPRAVVEAMARGLPCVATPVGGIPELLAAEDLAPVGDAAALAEKMLEVTHEPGRLAAMSARNLARARDFEASVLQPRREALWQHLREMTEARLQGRAH